MTTENTLQRTTSFRLPDPPPRDPDEMTTYDHVYKYASHRYLPLHFGNPYVTPTRPSQPIQPGPQTILPLATKGDQTQTPLPHPQPALRPIPQHNHTPSPTMDKEMNHKTQKPVNQLHSLLKR